MNQRSHTDPNTELLKQRPPMEREIARLRKLGDEMAKQIEGRWTGPGGCDCPVCSAAAAWREATAPAEVKH